MEIIIASFEFLFAVVFLLITVFFVIRAADSRAIALKLPKNAPSWSSGGNTRAGEMSFFWRDAKRSFFSGLIALVLFGVWIAIIVRSWK